MNDLSYQVNYSDAALLRKIGTFIKSRRISQNLTQDQLAEQAAMSRSTLSLAERGENITVFNLIKILRVLDALYVLEHFTAVPKISPIMLAQEAERERLRASKKKNQSDNDTVLW
ncbi:helix-turn-helix domain-containing protein [Flavobacterium sp. HSC-61S13]|uniref:helix-turn-helix domain-containing protein n=1 Tax=Flavobacterium sp. HSC-61S13 TaxID=2910963 RepID=UPI00209D0238|nr:helix-turn-helix transcriptional regulator [Flavobacterium sp. HSC-61S13]